MKKRFISVILSAMMIMTACAPKEETTSTVASKQSEKNEDIQATEAAEETSSSTGKTITIGTPYTIDTFLPWDFTSDGDRYVISNVYECLFEYDANTCIPVLAESYTNPDDCTWDVKIRENAYWHTGNKLFGDEKVQIKAEDVKWVMDWTMDPANGSKQQTNLSSVVSSVEVLDDFTLRFTTPEPKALFLFTLSRVMIFPKKAIDEGFDLNDDVSPEGISSSVVVTGSCISETTFIIRFSGSATISGQSLILGPNWISWSGSATPLLSNTLLAYMLLSK